MRKVLFLFFPALLAPGVPGQTKYLVSPQGNTTVEGSSNNTFPFYNKTFTYMQVHDDLAGRPRIIREIAFRKDGKITGSLASCTVNISLWISTAKVTSGSASTTYASNHGPDLVQVLNKTNINFPAASPTTTPPAPFTQVIPFPTKPFVYKGKGSLAWEVRVYSTTSLSSRPLDAQSSYSSYQRFGSGCQATGQNAPPYNYGYVRDSTTVPNAYMLYCYARNLAKSQPYVWMIGRSNTKFGGFKLPLNLSPFGGVGCSLYIAPILAIGGTTNASGYVSTYNNPVTFPKSPFLAGMKIYTQFLSADPGRAPLPAVFTDGCAITIPGNVPVCRIYSYGNPNALTGSKTGSYGLVTRFTYF